MEEKDYINKIVSIREDIDNLVNILWCYEENREAYETRQELKNQVISDILTGYEKELI